MTITPFRLLAGLALSLAAAGAAIAQTAAAFPSQPIKLVVPHPPGGFTDILARLAAQKMSPAIGQPVVVENRGGGGGTIAERSIATGTPDGHTVMITGRDITIRAELHDKLAYDPDKDFAFVSLLAWSPMVLVAHPAFPANSVQELVALAKRAPGTLNYASGGNGTGAHVATEMFSRAAGIQLVHVPYKGNGPATSDVIGGQVPLMLLQAAVALPHVASGKLKALAVPGAKRLAALPQVPTIAESGYPGFDVTPWFGIVAPAATPKPVVDRLAAEFHKVMNSPEVRSELARQGAEAVGSSADEFAALVRAESPRWKRVVREAQLRAD